MQPVINWILKVVYEWRRGRLDPSDGFIIAMGGLVLLIVLAGIV